MEWEWILKNVSEVDMICTISIAKALLTGNKSLIALLLPLESLCPVNLSLQAEA